MFTWFRTGCLLAGLSVVLGAFAAHGLDKFCVEKYPPSERAVVVGLDVPLSWKRITDFKTGAEYQMYHSLGLIAVGLLSSQRCARARAAAGWLFLLGIVGFSGSLYAITLTGNKMFGMIAPLGGTAFIAGWVALAFACGCTSATVPLGTAAIDSARE